MALLYLSAVQRLTATGWGALRIVCFKAGRVVPT